MLGGLAAAVLTICAAVLALAIGSSTGVQAGLIGLVFALLPLGVVVPAFLWLDRFEAEPRRLLLFAFVWGAVVASAVALVLNTSSIGLIAQVSGSRAEAMTVGSVTVAPVVEESLKGLAVLLLLIFRRREMDGVVDGMVYAGITAAGFAFAENILYLGRAFDQLGAQGLVTVFVLRGIMAPFAHPLFTICTGIGVGVAATTRHAALRLLAPFCGWVCAVLLHALWNLTSVVGAQGYFGVYLVLQVPIFLAFVGLAIWMRRREGRVIGLHLLPYVDAGWLTAGEVHMLSSMGQRRRARQWARGRGGPRAGRAMASFQDTASELALLRSRMVRGIAAPTAQQTEREMLDLMVTRRAQFLTGAGA
ncbi:PrsW family intramembrane metalloprotease [Segeticoccus sp.]|uniref:PrsW family intramembrane metalloprotease n=1 Tax=Segeticoccus sp. TaxID=2706531 RepID=UPI002D7FA8A9|nr:PrsW family intramembrane metalloprotease [Segeticoccus sp.]